MYAPPAQYVRTSDGYDIACFVAGEGPTLVRTPVVWNHISRQWRPDFLGPTLFDPLATRFRSVHYDGRGQGLSTRGLPEALCLDDLVLDLEAVADQLGGERFVLFGMSFAASVAIRYACEHPERVRALILWNFREYQTHTDAMIRLAMEDWQYHVQATVRVGFSEYDLNLAVEAALDSATQMDYIHRLKALRNAAALPWLAKVEMPTLLIAHRVGPRPVASLDLASRGMGVAPNSRLVLLDDPSTMGKMQNGVPEGVTAMVDFLADIDQMERGERVSLQAHLGGLSVRELEVLRLVATGKNNPEIAEALCISRNTVAKHVSSILVKIGAANRVEAAAYAYSHHVL